MNSIKAIQNILEVPSKLNKTETAVAANKLATARNINGTNFDGTADITTTNWGATRTFTIGNLAKNINGSTNVTWTLSDIGAASNSEMESVKQSISDIEINTAPANHLHDDRYLKLTGGTVTGSTTFESSIYGMNNIALSRGSLYLDYYYENKTCDYLRFNKHILASDDNKVCHLIDTSGVRADLTLGNAYTTSLTNKGSLSTSGITLTNTGYPAIRFSDNVRLEYDVTNDSLYAAGTKSTSSGLREFKATTCASTQYATIAGKKVFVQSDTPSGISTGDVWVQI